MLRTALLYEIGRAVYGLIYSDPDEHFDLLVGGMVGAEGSIPSLITCPVLLHCHPETKNLQVLSVEI